MPQDTPSSSPTEAAEVLVVREARQRELTTWARETFGENCMETIERALRVLEEALEVAQAAGVPEETSRRLLERVYGNPKGEIFKEVGQLGVTLLIFAQSQHISAEAAEIAETKRVMAIDPATFRARHAAKAKAGIALPGLT